MKTVLMDRDGTLIVDPPDLRIDSVVELKLFPDTIESLKYLTEHGFSIIVITNQAGIAEGRYTKAEYQAMHDYFLKMINLSGITVLETYMSPHEQASTNPWRKPGPGMLFQAAKYFDLNLGELYMVGDRRSDILAGINAGAKTILVQTGNDHVVAPEATFVAPNLLAAVKYIVASSK
jgi:histidinol-phosphate phosphatase family protein